MSGRKSQELEGITLLGNQKTKYPDDYAPEVLETFENKHPENDYFVKFNAPEFTSLCPITGQPDFATIYISYVPGERMVESKSLKLYLYSFRNHGDFHEDCMNIIMGFSIYGEDIYVDETDYKKAEGLLTVLWEAITADGGDPEAAEIEEMTEEEPNPETVETEGLEEESVSLYRADPGTRILLLTMLGIFGILVLYRLLASLYILFQTAV